METQKQKKQRLIRLIHVGKTQLMLSDEDYRALLANVSCGKTSSTKLTLDELELAVQALKARGFVVAPKAQAQRKQDDIKVRDAHHAVDGQIKKIRALWLDLHRIGAVRNPSELALAKFVKRMTGVDYHGWLDADHAQQVIEHLKQWLKREKTEVESG